MKKLYFVILVSFFSGTIFAQTYYPMLDSANEWSYTTHMYGVRIDPTVQSGPCSYPLTPWFSSMKEFTTIDTVINSLSYKRIDNNYQPCYLGFIREDTAARKIYFLSNSSTVEEVLYDFSMQVGDTMTLHFQPGAYASGLYTLDSITTLNIWAGPRRAFHLHCHAIPSSYEVLWVESVGNLNDLLYPYFNNDNTAGLYQQCPGDQHNFYQFLICFDHDYKVYFDQCTYTLTQNNPSISTFTDSCDYWSFAGAIHENYKEVGFAMYPNPSTGKTIISPEIKCAGEYHLAVYDATGKQMLKEITLGNLPEGKTEVAIDLSELKDGFYLLELRSPDTSSYARFIIKH